MMERVPQFLVIRGGAVGDFILTLPVLQALRTQWPDAIITVAGYPRIACLAEAAGWCDHVTSLDGADWARMFAWKTEPRASFAGYLRNFDVVIHYLFDPDQLLENNLKTAGVELVLHGPLRPEPPEHAADAWIRPLSSLAIFQDHAVPDLRPIQPRPAPGGISGPWVAIHPGSGGEAKRWPLGRFLAMGDWLQRAHGLQPVYLLGEADQDLALPDVSVIRNAELPELAGILQSATFYVGNDSGISHLAAAVGCPVLALFGPTDPGQWAPRGAEKIFCLRAPLDGGIAGLSLESVQECLRHEFASFLS